MAPLPQTSIVEDVSGNKRKLPGHARGAYAFSMFERRRAPRFLDRNIKHVQDFHQKQCQTRKSQNDQVSDNARLMAQIRKTTSNSAILDTNRTAGSARDKRPVFAEGTHSEAAEKSHDTSVPVSEAMSRRTLLVRDGNKRRISDRLAKQDQDPDAFLKIDLRNMRKKINFKDRVADDTRPSKRARRDTIPCDVHLTIWNNSLGQSNPDPVYTHSRVCDIVQDDRKDEGPGRFLELRLDRPWLIPRRDLHVHFEENGKLKSKLAERYFMEFKFVPMKTGPHWPPFNVLGKSDGDQQAKLDELTKAKLQHTLVARQHDLIAEPDKALSLFFFAEGRSMRTKYALAVDTQWISPETVSKDIVPEKDGLESWMLDENERLFGKEVKKIQARSKAARKSAANTSTTLTSAIPESPKIRWTFDPRKPIPEGAKRKYREFTTNGTDCYICAKSCQTTEGLLFHLERMHTSFNHDFEQLDESDGVQAGFAVAVNDCGKLQPKLRDNDLRKDTCFEWRAPDKPFDIALHTIKNDKSWLGLQAPPKPKTSATEQRRREIVEDPRTAFRAANGYLAWQFVRPFRQRDKQRRKHITHPLIHKRPLQATPYSSIAHRPLPVYDTDDQMSESDDEANDAYLADRWSQDLDLYARENSWSDAKRRLYKKWGYYVFYREQSPHPKYISDTLIRFVRQESDWLLRRGPRWPEDESRDDMELESITALEELLLELVSCRLIELQVCNEVLTMLDSNDGMMPLPPEERADEGEGVGPYVSKIARDEDNLVKHLRRTQLTSPLDICTVCKAQLNHNNHNTLRCSNTSCKQADHWYHAGCVGVELVVTQSQKSKPSKESSIPMLEKDFMRRRKNWKCSSCRPK